MCYNLGVSTSLASHMADHNLTADTVRRFAELVLAGGLSAAECLRRADPARFADRAASYVASSAYHLQRRKSYRRIVAELRGGPNPDDAEAVRKRAVVNPWLFAQGIHLHGEGPSAAYRRAVGAAADRMTPKEIAKAAAQFMQSKKYAASASHMPKGKSDPSA